MTDLVAEIEAGPEGPDIGAFFDFDGTLIAGYSARAFFEDRLRRLQVSPATLVRGVVGGIDASVRGGDETARLIEVAARASKGQPEADLVALGERLYDRRIAGMGYPEARALVTAHRRAGHTVALASAATVYQAGPYAADLGIDHLLCTRLEVGAGGRFTGLVDGPVLWGPAKAEAVARFADTNGIDLARSFGYANGDEDIPFLETLGLPRALNPGRRLARVAAERGWPVRRFGRRDGPEWLATLCAGVPPDGWAAAAGTGLAAVRTGAARDGLATAAGTGLAAVRTGAALAGMVTGAGTGLAAVRTGAALAGLVTGAGMGLAVGVAGRSRRSAANLASVAGSELALALAGVRLEVSGREHLWSHRPAVFVFNHQSSLDVLIVANLLRSDFTGVAKAEAARDFRFALFGWLADVAYVDRSDRQQAVASLGAAVAKLHQGTSIAIAPEGTRSPRLAPFKKGAFHLAVQAGAPVVPIVIRNAGELMFRGSPLVRPGTVDVAVLEPLGTSCWSEDDLDDHVAGVHSLFESVLDDWA